MAAMSGGVDSSVAAWLAQQAGYSCVGVTLRLVLNEDAGLPAERTCCSLADVEDARRAAWQLGMEHFTFNFTEEFREKVLVPFSEAYARGETPNPCIACNRYLKFGKLLRRADELGYGRIVTGHYARIERCGDEYLLRKAADETKDQSYVLYSLSQAQLARTLFPLGGLTKPEVRRIAQELGLVTAKKRDSQDLCFAPDGDYAGAAERCLGRRFPPGDFVDGGGRILGRHRGIGRYTVGQRKGLGLSAPEPLYVRTVLPERNEVVLGRDSELWSRALDAGDFRWVSGRAPSGTLRLSAKIRYRHRERPAFVTPTGPDTVRVVFDEAQRAITPGQSVVLYDGDTVVGGGIIRKAAGQL